MENNSPESIEMLFLLLNNMVESVNNMNTLINKSTLTDIQIKKIISTTQTVDMKYYLENILNKYKQEHFDLIKDYIINEDELLKIQECVMELELKQLSLSDN